MKNSIAVAESAIKLAEQISQNRPSLDMSIVRTEAEPAPQFPLPAFPPAFRTWLTTAADAKGAPVDYLAASLLIGTSGTIGNARRVSAWSGWVEPCALWAANVGVPSSGKSPAADAMLDPLRVLDADLGRDFPDQIRLWETAKAVAAERRDNWKAEVKAAVREGLAPPDMAADAIEPDHPVRPEDLVNDPTIESMAPILAGNPRGVLLSRDELSGWLGTMGKYGGDGDRSFWLEAFGGRPYVVDRVKHSRPITVPSLLVSIIGGIQPDKLSAMTDTDDGLASRFLFFWPAPKTPIRPVAGVDGQFIDGVLRKLLGLRMDQTDAGPVPHVLALSASAANLFDSWRQDHSRSESDVSGMALSTYGKAPGVVLRLALVIELLAWSVSNDVEPSTVSETAIQCAAAMVDGYFKPQARRVFGDAALPETDRNAALLARHILKLKPTHLNARDVRRAAGTPTPLRDPARMDAACATLVESGWLIVPERALLGHRPPKDFLVNQAVYEVAR